MSFSALSRESFFTSFVVTKISSKNCGNSFFFSTRLCSRLNDFRSKEVSNVSYEQIRVAILNELKNQPLLANIQTRIACCDFLVLLNIRKLLFYLKNILLIVCLVQVRNLLFRKP